jgi:hypothetical protein
MAIVAWLGLIALLFCVRYFWVLYTSTPVGNSFINLHPELAYVLNQLSSFPILSIPTFVVRETLVNCFVISVVAKLFYVGRFFYQPRGVLGKTLWGAAIAGIVAYGLWSDRIVDTFKVSYILAILPSLCLLPYCFDLSDRALPEIGDLFFNPFTRDIYRKIREKIKKVLNLGDADQT